MQCHCTSRSFSVSWVSLAVPPSRGTAWDWCLYPRLIPLILREIHDSVARSEPFVWLSRSVDALKPGGRITISGLSGSLLPFAIAHLQATTRRQLLILLPDRDHAEMVRDDCALLAGRGDVYLYVHSRHGSATPLDMSAPIAQIETLSALTRKEPVSVIASAEALIGRVPPPSKFATGVITVESGREISFEKLLQQLDDLEFERKDFVEGYGDFAVRGGILDVFPFAGEHPIRIEFWGDRVDSIREFDPLSQRSITELQKASLVGRLSTDTGAPGASVFDYLEASAILVVIEPVLVQKTIEELTSEGVDAVLDWGGLVKTMLSHPTVVHSSLSPSGEPSEMDFHSAPQPQSRGSIRLFLSSVSSLIRDEFRVYLACDTKQEAQRLQELMEEELTSPAASQAAAPSGVELDVPLPDEPPSVDLSKVTVFTNALHSGFVYPAARLAVFTEHELFGRLKRRGTSRRVAFRGISQKELQQLRRGDFVVHQDYGIGKFAGLQKIRLSGVEQEVMKLLYEENGVVYVNLNAIGRVQKYSSQEGHSPKLSTLGTPHWERLKERAKKRIKDIARELITLYARRKHNPGFAFSTDSHWQKEMEASFLYEDTPDQAKATGDVKLDMQNPSPMDRLICGDVGFGKTEVAVRAAFKAVLDGKQAAVLVPTTILAAQHANTFQDRLGRYGVKIASLSRFKSKKEQAEILDSLQRKQVDVLIGTHRILSKDVLFKDLGLLVIDEEHRFGVAAKEKLRHLRATVDTLTLTATPIPRTLQFSLLGARDLSIINTPPRNRLPIITEIAQFDLRLIRETILKELHRGGQVYFIHDRVHDIDTVHSLLEQHIPEARFHVAHGQMPGHELERSMLAFLERRYDVLVCTKIIESGIDIPSVNTIIVNRADRFGMAELYQLRGRVGRSNIQAYAYLLTPPLSSLPRPTLRRLQAIQEFTELGSGFNLALRDLEIRGAGNLLGAEQSGFILEMGFETYQRIVEEAVRELKEQEFAQLLATEPPPERPSVETLLETDIDAYIPELYVESDSERLDLYRRLYHIRAQAELESFRAELRDRFGEYPLEVEHLLGSIALRINAMRCALTKVSLHGRALVLSFPPSSEKWFYEATPPQVAPFQSVMARLPLLQRLKPALKQQERALELHLLIAPAVSPADRLVAAAEALATVFAESFLIPPAQEKQSPTSSLAEL